MAEALFNQLLVEKGLESQYEAQSAGVAASTGSPASIETRQLLLNKHEIDYTPFRSRQLNKYIMDECDYVFCLTRMHREAIITNAPEYREKVLLVGEFMGDEGTKDVADPFGLGAPAYEVVEGQLLTAVDNILSFVQDNGELQESLGTEL